jgi:hypothetical protein
LKQIFRDDLKYLHGIGRATKHRLEQQNIMDVADLIIYLDFKQKDSEVFLSLCKICPRSVSVFSSLMDVATNIDAVLKNEKTEQARCERQKYGQVDPALQPDDSMSVTEVTGDSQ